MGRPPTFLHIFEGEETDGQGPLRHFGELQQVHLNVLFDPTLGICDCGLMAERPVLYAMGLQVFVVVHQGTVSMKRLVEVFDTLEADGDSFELELETYLSTDIPTGDGGSDDEPDDAG
jgi:hypothetical protein